MLCPECKKQGLKSCVYEGISTTTCIGYTAYYDESGFYHNHDPNVTTTEYRCSNGHTWVERSTPHCWCGWRGGKLWIEKQLA